MSKTLFNVWKRPVVTHASGGDGKTLCGVDCSDSLAYDEGGFFDPEDADLYVNCRRCRQSIDRETMSNDWQEGYRAAMNDAASVARELYMNHVFHTGTGGLLGRCKQAEQVFLSDAAAASAP